MRFGAFPPFLFAGTLLSWRCVLWHQVGRGTQGFRDGGVLARRRGAIEQLMKRWPGLMLTTAAWFLPACGHTRAGGMDVGTSVTHRNTDTLVMEDESRAKQI